MPNQTLSLLQSQRLQMILSPQLRQSLEMLQVPIMELRSMIQQEIEQNPTIEELPLKQETVEIEPGAEKNESQENDADLKFDKEFEALAKLDDEWRDYFFQDYHQTMPYTIEDAEKRQFLLDSVQQKESLQEHLMNQLNLAGMPENDVKIGELIVESAKSLSYLAVRSGSAPKPRTYHSAHRTSYGSIWNARSRVRPLSRSDAARASRMTTGRGLVLTMKRLPSARGTA